MCLSFKSWALRDLKNISGSRVRPQSPPRIPFTRWDLDMYYCENPEDAKPFQTIVKHQPLDWIGDWWMRWFIGWSKRDPSFQAANSQGEKNAILNVKHHKTLIKPQWFHDSCHYEKKDIWSEADHMIQVSRGGHRAFWFQILSDSAERGRTFSADDVIRLKIVNSGRFEPREWRFEPYAS